jgi:hypothetical protein
MNRDDAKAALRAQGIRNPSRQLVEDYMRVQQAEEWALEVPERSTVEVAGERRQTAPLSALLNSAPERTERPHPSSESNLEPLLRECGELQRPAGRRKPGRPRVLAPWMAAVAKVMSDGTTLRQALSRCGIYGLTPKQLRSLYRNRAFQALYKEARRKWLSEYGVKVRPRGKGLRQLLRSL